MNRRETIKSLLLGSVATGIMLNGCGPEILEDETLQKVNSIYGRTPKEKLRDQEIFDASFFNQHELSTIAVLCDLILPSTDQNGSATDAGVHDFIAFIVKDLEKHQIPLRGGLMWLDSYSNRLYDKEFVKCSDEEHRFICDQIAYPEQTKSELKQGEEFFTRMRNLTVTGYFTTKMGIEDLGYRGNTPNVWDGVPEDVLKAHGLAYDKEWLAKCVDQSKRGTIAQWDDDGNIIG